MNTYVGVIFENNGGKVYSYKVPSYVKKIKVNDYVIVDTRHLAFTKLNCKTAKVVCVFDDTDTKAKIAKAYIVDKINFKPYFKMLKSERKKREAKEKLENFENMILDQYEEKVKASSFMNILEVIDSSGELTKKYEKLVKEVE